MLRPAPIFFCSGKAARGCVDDAPCFDVIDSLRHSSESHDEFVHHETGIHAGSNQRDAPVFGLGIEFGGEIGIGAKGIRKLLAGGNDTRFRFKAGEQFGPSLWEAMRKWSE